MSFDGSTIVKINNPKLKSLLEEAEKKGLCIKPFMENSKYDFSVESYDCSLVDGCPTDLDDLKDFILQLIEVVNDFDHYQDYWFKKIFEDEYPNLKDSFTYVSWTYVPADYDKSDYDNEDILEFKYGKPGRKKESNKKQKGPSTLKEIFPRIDMTKSSGLVIDDDGCCTSYDWKQHAEFLGEENCLFITKDVKTIDDEDYEIFDLLTTFDICVVTTDLEDFGDYTGCGGFHLFYIIDAETNKVVYSSEKDEFFSNEPGFPSDWDGPEEELYKVLCKYTKTFGNVTEDDQQIYKMIQDLQSDEAPDLAIGIQKNYAMRDDIFKDLTGFLSPEILDKQYVNIFEAGRINGKLYFLPVTLEIEGLVTNTELLKDGAVGLTFEEYDELVEGPMNGFSPYDYPDSTVYNKRDFLLSCIDTKSAIEGDAVDFGTEQFRCAVEHAAAIEYDDLADTPREYLDNWNRYRGECYYLKIDDYLDYVYACFRPKGEYRIIGTPSVDASGPRFKALETVSVSASTDVEEGCKKFLNYLFAGEAFAADNCEFRQIVTNKEIMEKNIQSLTKINNDLYERYMANVQSGAFIPAAGLDKASGNKAATDVMHGCFTDSLATISTYYYEDYTIVQFTLEELAPYYAGDRSLDDAIKYLNDRATKYIREM